MGHQKIRYEFIVRAEGEGISHQSGTVGNVGIFMRKKARLPGGAIRLVPEVTGDSVRHDLKEVAVLATLDAAGILDDPQLSRGALRLLFNGGMVTGKGDASVITIDHWRKLAALFPVLPLFGGCIDNGPRDGQLNVDALNVLSTETLGLMPDWCRLWLEAEGEHLDSYRHYMERVTRVRMDPELSENKIKLLSTQAQVDVRAKMTLREKAHEDGDSIDADKSKSSMMPRSFERIIKGTLLWGGITATTYSDLEFDAFNYCFASWLCNASVGGKAATGHGRLKFIKGHRIPFSLQPSVSEDVTTQLSGKVGTLFTAKVRERKDELLEWLRSEINA